MKRKWKNSELTVLKVLWDLSSSEVSTIAFWTIPKNLWKKSKLYVILEELKKVKRIELTNQLSRVMGLKSILSHVKFWNSWIIWRNWMWAISNRFKRKSIRLFYFRMSHRTLETKLLSWWTKLNSKVGLKGKDIT